MLAREHVLAERTFMESEPQTRLQLLTAMRADYGPYFTRAATEAGLPAPVVALGTALEQLPPPRRGKAIFPALTRTRAPGRGALWRGWTSCGG